MLKQSNHTYKKYAFWFALFAYWISTLALFFAAPVNSLLHPGYPLDDPYIHMAIAKHFVNNDLWGVSLLGFSSSTSSPLWTFLIALIYKVMGVNDWLPLILNLSAGSAIIFCCYYFLQKNTQPLVLAFFLMLIIFLTPLPVLTLTGMEHTLQTLFVMCFGYLAAVHLGKDRLLFRDMALLGIFAGLVTITRYEGMFLVFSAIFLFSIGKRFAAAAFIGIGGLIPILAYGLYSLRHGWYFLPNSILLKSNMPHSVLAAMMYFLYNIYKAPHMLALIVAVFMVYLWCEINKLITKTERYLAALFLLTALLHMGFAQSGWFYRYESYLITSGIIVLLHTINLLPPAKLTDKDRRIIFNNSLLVLFSAMLALPLLARAGEALRAYPAAVTNIYEQQYQMGLFLKKDYAGETIVANDIGAINYLADIQTLDILGLASREILQAKQDGTFNADYVGGFARAHNAKIAVIYESAFRGNIPSEWVEVGKWRITNNIVCYSDTVTFYAVNEEFAQGLTDHLRDFSSEIPPTVIQSGAYVDAK